MKKITDLIGLIGIFFPTKVFLIIVGVVLAIAVVIFFILGIEPEPVVEVEQRDLQAELNALYEREGVPLSEGAAQSLSEVGDINQLKGSIVFTAKTKDTDESITLWSLDTTNATSTPQQLLPTLKISGMAEFEQRKDGTDVLYFSTVSEPSKLVESDAFGIHRYDKATGGVTYFDGSPSIWERNLALSPDKRYLAFSRLQSAVETGVDMVPVDAWEVVVMDLENNAVNILIEGATLPKWSPDGLHLLYEKKDGLYVYNIKAGTGQKVTEIEGELFASSMFDLSPDGKYVLTTYPKNGLIVLYEVTSWSPLLMEERGRITTPDTEYYWPQFSPDSAFYVVQAIDDAGGTRLNERLEIRPVLGEAVIRSFTLSRFDFNSLFTDTWTPSEDPFGE